MVTGAVCIPFRYLIGFIASFRAKIFNPENSILIHIGVFFLMYFILLLVYLLSQKFSFIKGSGLPQTQAILYGKMVTKTPIRNLLIKFVGGILSIGTGLSLGREGTSVQMGSLVGLWTAKKMSKKPARTKHLVAAGAGAGVSAAFTAPLASSVLILESLLKFNIPKTAITTLLAGIISGVMAMLFITDNIFSTVKVAAPAIEEKRLLLIFLVMAIIFSIAGKLFSELLKVGKRGYSEWKVPFYIKIGFLAATTWVIGYFFST